MVSTPTPPRPGRLGLRCCGQDLLLETSNPEVLAYARALKRVHVFSVEPIDCEQLKPNPPRLRFEEDESDTLSFDSSTRTLTLRTNWSRISKSHPLEVLLMRLLGIACFDSQLVVVHAGAVATSDGAYLFVGGTGCGKTSMIVPLCIQNGCEWIANDYLCLKLEARQEVVVCERDDFIDFRHTGSRALTRVLPGPLSQEIHSRFPAQPTPWAKSTPPFLPGDLGLSVATLPCPVRGIFFPRVSDDTQSFTAELPKPRAASYLLAEIPWSVRGGGSAMTNDNGEALLPFLSSSPQDGRHPLSRILHILVTRCPAWAVQGSLEPALEFVTSKMD